MEGRRAVRRGSVRLIAIFGLAALLAVAVGAVRFTDAAANTVSVKRYNVVFEGSATTSGFSVAGGRDAALALVTSAGGTVVHDLTKQIGVVTAVSANPAFASVVGANANVDVVGEDFTWKAFPTVEEALSTGDLTVVRPEGVPGGGPEPSNDALENQQWALKLICVKPDTRPGCGPAGSESVQAGSRLVEVGVLDTGIDSAHPDFTDDDGTNVNCAKGMDFIPAGPGVGLPTPCTDNNFHGTHVAGIIGARANNPTGIPGAGIGIRGVAPNVELIPVKVCDAVGYCYASSTAAGITYAGIRKFEVINMSFFVDDDVFLQSTEFKCMSDPVQRAFRLANERAIVFARSQGVVPVAALGNSDQDLAHPVDDDGQPISNECEVVPAETQGVIGTMALGRFSEKASYSNYGDFATDVAAPGGNFGVLSDTPNEFCEEQILSTIPVAIGAYGCFQGTSMASPHAAGVAALIVSQFGRVGNDAGEPDVVMRPQDVEQKLQSTTVDIGKKGYDECFGNGRINALRAVLHETSNIYDPTAPFCPEYEE
jgi:lantibiotic leader peptide-processing serine protease